MFPFEEEKLEDCKEEINYLFMFSIHRVGRGDPVVGWRAGLVPQNVRGGDHKPQCSFAKPP